MEKVRIRIIKSEEVGLFHSSRQDTRTLAKAVNVLIDKVNELIEEINRLNSEPDVQGSVATEDHSSTGDGKTKK